MTQTTCPPETKKDGGKNVLFAIFHLGLAQVEQGKNVTGEEKWKIIMLKSRLKACPEL